MVTLNPSSDPDGRCRLLAFFFRLCADLDGKGGCDGWMQLSFTRTRAAEMQMTQGDMAGTPPRPTPTHPWRSSSWGARPCCGRRRFCFPIVPIDTNYHHRQPSLLLLISSPRKCAAPQHTTPTSATSVPDKGRSIAHSALASGLLAPTRPG